MSKLPYMPIAMSKASLSPTADTMPSSIPSTAPSRPTAASRTHGRASLDEGGGDSVSTKDGGS